MSVEKFRRVVTGVNDEGRSCVIIDGPAKGTSPGIVWRSDSVPADNSGTEDVDVPVFGFDQMNDGSSNCLITEYPPGTDIDLHATNTLDYVIVLKGEVVLTLEEGQATLRAGDLLVDRGVVHGWRNDGDDSAVIMVVTIPAIPGN